MSNTFQVSRTALLTVLLALPVGAFAQSAAPTAANPADTTPMSAPRTAAPQAAASPANADQPGRREARVEQRIADLHSRLQITPAQQSQWDQFAKVMRDNAQSMDQIFGQRSGRIQQMSAVDNMQSYAQIAEAHAQDVQKLVPAFESLYNSMSPDQKRTADQVFRSYAERGQQRALNRHHG